MKVQRTIPRVGKPLDKMYVTEWLHQESNRFVKLHFGPDLAIYTVNRKGEVQCIKDNIGKRGIAKCDTC